MILRPTGHATLSRLTSPTILPKCHDTRFRLVILQLDCCAAVISLLITWANLEERRRNQHPGTASSAPGLKHFGALWSLVGALCKRLSFAERVSFDSRKPVHRVAALLMILHVTLIFGRLALNEEFGGLDPYTSDELSALLQLAISASLSILVALLGVGWGTRRKLTAVMRRLDLRIPDRRDWLAGLLTAIGLFAMAQAATVLWAQSVSADVFEAQTSSSRLIFNSFNGSLVAGLLLALFTGVSEETLVSWRTAASIRYRNHVDVFRGDPCSVCLHAGCADSVCRFTGFRLAQITERYQRGYYRACCLQLPALFSISPGGRLNLA